MAFNFKDKSVQTSTNVFLSIIDRRGTVADIDAAFEALNAVAPDMRSAIIDDVEEKVIVQAKRGVVAWNQRGLFSHEYGHVGLSMGLGWQSRDEAEDMAMLEELSYLKPAARALEHIARIKGDKAQFWTAAFAKEFSTVPAQDAAFTDKVVECFVAAHEEADGVLASIRKSPDGAASIIRFKLSTAGAKSAITEFEKACARHDRESLVGLLEKRLAASIRTYAKITEEPMPVPSPRIAQDLVKAGHEAISFAEYVVKARGEAADPLLKAYVKEAAGLLEEQRNTYAALAALPARALKAATEDALHEAAAGKQDKLKKLAVEHKVRFGNRAPAP